MSRLVEPAEVIPTPLQDLAVMEAASDSLTRILHRLIDRRTQVDSEFSSDLLKVITDLDKVRSELKDQGYAELK